MIDFGLFLCIIQNIFFLLTLVSFEVTDNEKFGIIFMGCWVTSIFLLLLYKVLTGGAT